MNKTILKNVNGILLLDKSFGVTSNGALQRVKHLFSAKKAGHTGSLDPLATGMLPICFGEATKFSQYLLESDKKYEVMVKLGVKTTTGDAEGEVIETKPVINVTLERITQSLKQFIGVISQIPPMFSALKFKGKPLYELARKGIEITRAPRTVNIYRLQCDGLQDDIFKLSVHCSKGTYIRTLAEDIGEVLGCGAHVHALRRTAVTPYEQGKMFTLSTLEEIQKKSGWSALIQLLLPIESSIQMLPFVKLSTSAAFYMRMGQSVMVPHLSTHGIVRMYGNDGSLIGVGEITEDGRVAPRRLVAAAPSKMAKVVGEV